MFDGDMLKNENAHGHEIAMLAAAWSSDSACTNFRP